MGRPGEDIFLAVVEDIAQTIVIATIYHDMLTMFGTELQAYAASKAIFKFIVGVLHIILLVDVVGAVGMPFGIKRPCVALLG